VLRRCVSWAALGRSVTKKKGTLNMILHINGFFAETLMLKMYGGFRWRKVQIKFYEYLSFASAVQMRAQKQLGCLPAIKHSHVTTQHFGSFCELLLSPPYV
jgi:hypothetical protein